ncbi:tumor necrosis factor ligand superfamily member 10 [Mytilus galloprovincialis]|uniref:Tumor necrosis factor ligand superfamily member 10 n=1 Tax=Mytilus galloprovincialis TaxID=29158 RepID=A0A8B6DJQ5_MYTGA|nr:tumor necrosis factor ligand superfamily member 10 [Mytilus galloprovincialis]
MEDNAGTSAQAGEADKMIPTTKDKDKDKKESSGGKYMKKTTLTILLGILNVFLLAILCFIIAFFVKDKSQRVIINPSKTFCLPCDEVSIHPDDDPINFRQFSKREENGKEICCADEGQNLDKLMELYVERKHAMKASAMNTQELQAACNSKVDDFEPRVIGRVAGISSTSPDGVNHKVNWKMNGNEKGLYFKDNVTYSNGQFVIGKPGYYYVYSQVTLDFSAAKQDQTKSLCHYLYKTPKTGQPDKLLENSRTRCKFQGSSTQSTSYIGAVFNFNKDDKLMVKVSDPAILDRADSKSYFGLHII